jgi:hypothetical protein
LSLLYDGKTTDHSIFVQFVILKTLTFTSTCSYFQYCKPAIINQPNSFLCKITINPSEEVIGKEISMSVAKITEISATSKKSFDDALKAGVKRANKTLKKVLLKVTFVLE